MEYYGVHYYKGAICEFAKSPSLKGHSHMIWDEKSMNNIRVDH